MSSAPVVTRFAPSPTGAMHLGNARTALFNALLAARSGGRFVLRIEDTDAKRSDPAHARRVIEDLAWLGLRWDGEVVYQSARLSVYAERLRRLREAGAAYPCFCTPAELEAERAAQRAAGRPPRYSRRCRDIAPAEAARRLAAGAAAAIRFRVPDEGEIAFDDLVHGPMRFRCADLGDFVLSRADGSPAFFFCNAIDDADIGITDVLRGEDHLANVPRQLLLFRALDLPSPRYGHLALLNGTDGQPLSKRTGAASIAALREAGYLPAAVTNLLFRLGHHAAVEDLLDLPSMARAFDPAGLQRAPAIADPAQLLAWQRRAVAALDEAARVAWLAPALPPTLDAQARAALVAAIGGNVLFPADAASWARIVGDGSPEPDEAARAAIDRAPAALFDAASRAAAAGAGLREIAAAVTGATGLKGRAVYEPLRAALTGRLDGPELASLLPLIGRAAAGSRLARFA